MNQAATTFKAAKDLEFVQLKDKQASATISLFHKLPCRSICMDLEEDVEYTE